MWPGRPSAWSSTVCARSRVASHVASNAIGSRLPWTANSGAEPIAGRAETDAPIDADHVRPGGCHQFEQTAGTDAEEDDRDTAGFGDLDRSPRVGQDIVGVVGWAQLAAPAIEELERVRAGLGLGEQVVRRRPCSAWSSARPRRPARSS